MKYYCIGIKGSGMATLAEILYDLGNSVIGYDDYKDYKFTEIGLQKRNIKIYYDNIHKIDSDTIVTYSKAFSRSHPEIKRIHELNLKVIEYNDLLGKISKMFKTVSVCGTHGKTTTTTMISNVLSNTVGCNYFIGDGSGYANKNNELFVLESCEYQRHFLSYFPYYSIVTNIELEHTECYKDIDDIINTFEEFCNKATKVIANGDDENIKKMNINKEIMYYGFNNYNDVIIKNISLTDKGSSFDLYYHDEFYYHFEVPVYGKHMVEDATACICLCMMENIPKEKIHDILNNFKNAKRRFNEKIFGDVVEIDDYAHHPTEIKVTLESARQKYPDKEIVAVFLPNTYSRTNDLMNDFVSALKTSDKTYLFEIECDRERKEDFPGVTSENIVNKINRAELIDKDSINKLLIHKNSVICFMSCANISKYEKIFESMLDK